MSEHVYVTGEPEIEQKRVYRLLGYPKRYKYKTPRWKYLYSDTSILVLLKEINCKYRFREPYVFKIKECNITLVNTPVSLETIMLIKIKEGV